MPPRLHRRLLTLLALVGFGPALIPPGRAALPDAAARAVAAASSDQASAGGGPTSGGPSPVQPLLPRAVPPSPASSGAPPPPRAAALPRPPGDADLTALTSACQQWIAAGDSERLGRLRQRLLTRHPAPQPLAVLLADAEALLACRMPQAALEVLERISPAAGRERQQWLILQWRAADASLDHRRAALTLLAVGQPQQLEALQLPLQRRQDGGWTTRSALEVLASHLEALGQERSAGSLLLQSSASDATAAERLGQALRLLDDLPASQREALFERALARAAAAGSWGLASDLLRAQAALPASPATLARNRERRLRLSRRLDDAYSLWQILADDPAAAAQRRQLEQQLRSPQAPGGHAATLPPPEPIQTPAASGSNATGPAGAFAPLGPGPSSAPSPP